MLGEDALSTKGLDYNIKGKDLLFLNGVDRIDNSEAKILFLRLKMEKEGFSRKPNLQRVGSACARCGESPFRFFAKGRRAGFDHSHRLSIVKLLPAVRAFIELEIRDGVVLPGCFVRPVASYALYLSAAA
jgi:hypothetical protein